MWKRCTSFVSLVVLLALIQGATVFGAWNFLEDPALIGWWTCDEGAGAVVADSSANGNDGTIINGDPAWGPGVYGSSVILLGPTLVEVPAMGLTLTEATIAGWFMPFGTQPDWASIIMHRFGEPPRAHGFNLLANGGLAYHWNDSSATWSFRPNAQYSATEWTFCALTVAPDKATFYINGEAKAENVIAHEAATWDGPIRLGGDGTDSWVARRMNGNLDDVSFFSRALAAEEVQAIMSGLTAAGLAGWENAATAAAPAFFATNVADGMYDIGALGGEITYEFVVQSNPGETQASMALIGRRNFGDTRAGLKYEQWNNTGTYGATLFGVVDLDFGVANNPGVVTHLVFVSSEAAGTTDLYVDGVYQASVPNAITLSGNVGIGLAIQSEDGTNTFDDFDGEIFGVAIYDRALSKGEIRVNSDAYFLKGPSDITTPGDVVQGIPTGLPCGGSSTANYSPCGELPPLVIDNSSATKYLNFGGNFDPNEAPSGFQVTPSLGATIVTGLTFTTANDSAPRDPIAFELYGSNESIDGPYELIAAGEIVDFNMVDAWPRFTMNATPITFENTVAYEHYQVLFTAIRGTPAQANSMQIAEVELIGVPAVVTEKPLVVWVSFHGADDMPGAGAAGAGFTEAPDKGYTDLLKAAGYDVMRYVQTGTPDPAIVDAADLVIISRSVNSGSFSNAAATTWNSVSTPMIIVNGYTIRNSRMGFATGGTIPDTTGDITLTASDPNHPIFAGIALTDGTMDNPYAGVVVYPTDGTTVARGISIVTDAPDDEATVLATVSAASEATGPVGAMVIAEWPAGATLTHAGGAETDVLAGPRLVFLTGAREASGISSETAGMYDLYEDGAQMFLNAVAYMLP